jgi:splicing factor 3B subunit 1
MPTRSPSIGSNRPVSRPPTGNRPRHHLKGEENYVINAVMEAIEGMRVALGAAVILNYCLQGLFHPARKVCEVYWKIYNSLYIGAQDALVAAYPALEDDEDNIFNHPELAMFV